MNYHFARRRADRIVEILSPFVSRIDIAGSIRRLKPTVKDIEICCIPKTEFVNTDLFGAGHHVRVKEFAAAIKQFEKSVIKGNPDGRYMQIVLIGSEDMKLDLFMPQESDYYRQLAIRTGSADYSHQILAVAWQKLGWVGTSDGLRKSYQCIRKAESGKPKWVCTHPNPELPPIWNSEQELFHWLNLDYLEPQFRNV